MTWRCKRDAAAQDQFPWFAAGFLRWYFVLSEAVEVIYGKKKAVGK